MVPRLIAFDLDGTLWRPEMYELWGGGAPFTLDDCNTLQDRKQTKVRLLGETAAIMEELRHAPYADTTVVWVSCTDEPSWAAECLQKFVTSDGVTPLRDVCDSKLNKIFKSNKRVHFEQLHKDTGIPYADMLFFDNEGGNIHSVEKLGVASVLCPSGMTRLIWDQGLLHFAKQRGGAPNDAVMSV